MQTTARVAGRDFDLDAEAIEGVVADLDPEPIREHYVVVRGQRYPPKQVLAAATGLDRADFTTHQARAILRRLGFGVYRLGYVPPAVKGREDWPHGGAEAALLEPYKGRWIAQEGLEVLFVGDSPEEVVGWLRRHGKRATVWRVPTSRWQVGSMMSTP